MNQCQNPQRKHFLKFVNSDIRIKCDRYICIKENIISNII